MEDLRDRPESRDTRELEAEAAAFVVGQAVGLEIADAPRDYIHLYRGQWATASFQATSWWRRHFGIGKA